MGICTAKGTEWTRRRWVRRCSTMGWAVGLVSKLNVRMTQDGAIPAARRLLLRLLISALRTLLCPVIMADGVILLARISIWLCLCFSRLLSIAPESFPSPTAGQPLSSSPVLFLFCSNYYFTPSVLTFLCFIYIFFLKRFSVSLI